jgi:predicted RND superfamily exporter protein
MTARIWLLRAPWRTVVAGLLFATVTIWVAGSLGSSSTERAVAAATLVQQRTFGGEPITISLQGNLATTLDPSNLHVLVTLERRLASLPGVRMVSGPGTFIEQTVYEIDGVIDRELAATGSRGAAAARQELSELLVRYGYTGVPSLDNTSFVGQLIFGAGTQPKQRFAWLFPDDDHALVLVRPQAGLSDAGMRALSDRIKRLVGAAPLQGVQTRELGTVRQLWVEIQARDVTTPAVLGWMNDVETRVLSLDPRLRPGPNLAALLESGAGDTVPSGAEIHSLLALVPSYFTAPVLSPDHTRAELSFGLPLVSSGEQAGLVGRIARVLSNAPKGVSAHVAGAIALSAASAEGLGSVWLWLAVAVAVIVFVLLLLRVSSAGAPFKALRSVPL